ncbi:MAG TPA: RtcB family protein [Thermomicrobiales bacterium]|jgi:tRNA-splicing ligase RtcB|nr:RtcB family protein [Thermomicrobiales bacterium]
MATHGPYELDGANVPVLSWLPPDEIEPAALDQIRSATTHPDAAIRLAVMPDCHVGFGVTIGSVLPTANAVLPNAVGVDIGCGMSAIPTGVMLDRDRMDMKFWRTWSGNVQRNVPSGFDAHRTQQNLGELDRPLRAPGLWQTLRDKAATQLGTLGGGNHFLEAQEDEDGQIWLMVHSGSRHTGLRIARHYETLAEEIAIARGIAQPKDLAALPTDDQTGQDYLHDMTWATDYALESRRRMLQSLVSAFQAELDRLGYDAPEPAAEAMINIHHNFARAERHDGQDVIVHRKGATSAAEDEIGIIPGSMGTPSYIVRGRGNPDSLASCSHGAGRIMSRKAARERISPAEFAASLAGTYSKASPGVRDEAPGVYKDIAAVIERQRDLVEVVHTLRPIITIKGDSRARDD